MHKGGPDGTVPEAAAAAPEGDPAESLAEWLAVHPEIRSLVDAPCGDFGWVPATGLPGLRYDGPDIAARMVAGSRPAPDGRPRRFLALDALDGPLPDCDAWLCRDLLRQLPAEQAAKAVAQFCNSHIPWLLAVTRHGAAVDATPCFGLDPPVQTLADVSGRGDMALGAWLNPRYARVGGARLTLVTVAFRRDLPALALQARSIARHMEPGGVAEIIVIGNDTDDARLAHRFEAEVVPEYGPFADRLRFIPGALVAPDGVPGGGWPMQQLLKLRVGALVTTPAYLVLDAKNAFVRPARRDAFLAPDGRARSWLASYRRDFESRFRHSLGYFGLDPDRFAAGFPPSVTPVVLEREMALAMMREVERREGCPFGAFLLANLENVTEFLLYHAYLCSRPGGMDAALLPGPNRAVTLWGDKPADPHDFATVMWLARQRQTLCFGVHHTAIPALDAAQRAAIARHLLDAGLLATAEETGRFVALDAEGG